MPPPHTPKLNWNKWFLWLLVHICFSTLIFAWNDDILHFGGYWNRKNYKKMVYRFKFRKSFQYPDFLKKNRKKTRFRLLTKFCIIFIPDFTGRQISFVVWLYWYLSSVDWLKTEKIRDFGWNEIPRPLKKLFQGFFQKAWSLTSFFQNVGRNPKNHFLTKFYFCFNSKMCKYETWGTFWSHIFSALILVKIGQNQTILEISACIGA